ncbi:MAG: hypothetical protein H7235_06815 [Bdellovibrionaceae bacterium]|nr:hypothetical protein [Pseudobdellovibrionaceae bacterium]
MRVNLWLKKQKAIGGNQKAVKLIYQATMGLSDKSDGVVISKKEMDEKTIKEFITNLAEHRHWLREDTALALPY